MNQTPKNYPLLKPVDLLIAVVAAAAIYVVRQGGFAPTGMFSFLSCTATVVAVLIVVESMRYRRTGTACRALVIIIVIAATNAALHQQLP